MKQLLLLFAALALVLGPTWVFAAPPSCEMEMASTMANSVKADSGPPASDPCCHNDKGCALICGLLVPSMVGNPISLAFGSALWSPILVSAAVELPRRSVTRASELPPPRTIA